MIFRAINVQLAHRDQCTRLAVVIVAALHGLDVPVDRAGDRLVRAARLVLVDHRGSLAVVAHPRHQVLAIALAPNCPARGHRLNADWFEWPRSR